MDLENPKTSGSDASLSKGLKQRHVAMIALGGVIGAGLFVGSGVVIKAVGPGSIVTYILSGLLIVLVMRMLGEMAAAHPSTGSFAEYARQTLGGWAGYTVAWLYWYFWVVVMGFEAVAGAAILQKWLPGVPLWSMSLGLLMLMTATNLYSVRSYGEFEYWFALIKVAAICIFLALGSCFVLGIWPGHSMDFSNLTSHGGFMPTGPWAMFSGMVIVVFSMVGAEIATIAAAESDDPEHAVVKATNSVVLRICIFFVGSIALLVVILPWNGAWTDASPYVAAFQAMGLTWASDAMNAVVLTAVLSCLNSGLYTASRMLFVLAGRSDAPGWLLKTSKREVPWPAILVSTLVGYLCVICAYVSPKTVFLFLLNSSGAIILLVYIMIALSQLLMRPTIPAERLRVKMWFYPYLTVATIAAMVAVLVLMGIREDSRSQLFLSLLTFAVVVGSYPLTRRFIQTAEPIPARVTGTMPRFAARVLIVANETVDAQELLTEIRQLRNEATAKYDVCMPIRPLQTGHGPAWSTEASGIAAAARLDGVLGILRDEGLQAEGELGDYRPMQAMDDAVTAFKPNLIMITTHPFDRSPWLKAGIVEQARDKYGIAIRHIISGVPVAIAGV
jgi:GABA permease